MQLCFWLNNTGKYLLRLLGSQLEVDDKGHELCYSALCLTELVPSVTGATPSVPGSPCFVLSSLCLPSAASSTNFRLVCLAPDNNQVTRGNTV